MRSALLIAFHFPPFHGSSGLQRTLSFCRDLPESGWRPCVLSAAPRAYARTSDDQMRDVPADVPVRRAFALDSSRHLAVGGRYLRATALPDKWISWLPGAILAGLDLIRREQIGVIWSTYPIATAHLIGWALHRLTGLPWVADFRDPMVETIERTGEQFPRDPSERRARLFVESRVARRANCAVFCTDSALDIYARRYPQVAAQRMRVIENGFDESIFAEAEGAPRPPRAPTTGRPLVLLHSGVLYRSTDRSPEGLFDALKLLRDRGKLADDDLRVVLRATGNDAEYGPMIEARGLQRMVRLESSIGYREALAEMLAVDGLLLFQGYTSNPAIPAKAYEYLRARRPVFALVDAEGETARLVARTQVGRTAPLDEPERIAAALLPFLAEVRADAIPALAGQALQRFSRQARATELAALFDQLMHDRQPTPVRGAG